jgi:predicted O-methyltransferase YrrM
MKQESSGPKEIFFVPPGHFYSPLISVDEILANHDQIWHLKDSTLSGINLNISKQKSLAQDFKEFYNLLPFEDEANEKNRYHYLNDQFSYGDAVILFSLIMSQKPKRIIEIGSGYGSAVMLDTNELFFDSEIELTFIEPYPDRLKSLIKPTEQCEIISEKIQHVDLDIFTTLEAGDILFIDSTHVAKTGSDVNTIIFNILPILKRGVIIHFHDIFYPFEYPIDWVLKDQRNWNEAYFLRAFLSFNNSFRITYFNSFITSFNERWFSEHMPLCLKNPGGSIWVEKY